MRRGTITDRCDSRLVRGQLRRCSRRKYRARLRPRGTVGQCADGFVAEGCVGGGGFDDAMTQPTGARHASARTGAPDDHGRPRRPCIGYRSTGSTVGAGGGCLRCANGACQSGVLRLWSHSDATEWRSLVPGPRFFEICAAHDRPINDDERLQAACDTGYEFLAAHHDRVPDLAAETHQFDEYYRIVLDVLGTGRTDGLTAELAAAAVNEVNFEPYPTTASLLDELAARGIPMAVITDASAVDPSQVRPTRVPRLLRELRDLRRGGLHQTRLWHLPPGVGRDELGSERRVVHR